MAFAKLHNHLYIYSNHLVDYKTKYVYFNKIVRFNALVLSYQRLVRSTRALLFKTFWIKSFRIRYIELV